jgi:hypothetical protein
MALVLGLNAKAYRNTASWASPTWDEVTNLKDVTINLEAGDADVTTRGGGGFRQSVGTLKDGSVDFQMVWDTADADFTAFKDAFFNNTSIELAFMDGAIATTGSQGLHADFSVVNFSRSEALEEALMVDVTVKITKSDNTPEWLTVS